MNRLEYSLISNLALLDVYLYLYHGLVIYHGFSECPDLVNSILVCWNGYRLVWIIFYSTIVWLIHNLHASVVWLFNQSVPSVWLSLGRTVYWRKTYSTAFLAVVSLRFEIKWIGQFCWRLVYRACNQCTKIFEIVYRCFWCDQVKTLQWLPLNMF